MFVRVLPDQAAGRLLDYRVPEALLASVGVGSIVKVPVRTRLLTATVIEMLEQSDVRGLRDLVSLVGDKPMIQPALLDLAKWMADYYCCPLEVSLRSMLPVAVRDGLVSKKTRQAVKMARDVSEEEIAALAARAPRQADALRAVQASETPLLVSAAAEAAGVAEAVFRSLEKRGLVVIEPMAIARDPYAERFLASEGVVLNAEQTLAMKSVVSAMDEKRKPILLFGVTGSGKTEIYLRAIQHALDIGKTALVLVPEIALTPQTVERFKSRFSEIQETIAVLHSHLSEGERHDEWHKIRNGFARVVIGARSSIFAPVENLGIIIVDEEHETSYKQDEAPRYHARDMAVLRAHREGAAVVLGSATPSLESWHNATTGKYELVRLDQRVDDKKMPIVRVLDLRQQARSGGGEGGILSKPLREALEGRLERGEQSLLFLNRRGFATSMVCEACGYVSMCPDCSVALTYHRAAEKLICHICGHSERAPKKCPKCDDPRIRNSGVGTQKIEESLQGIFPKARIARMDADSMTRKDSYRVTLGAFKEGKIDILVGTQMIAKGLHFPNVTLVGIVNADLGLHLPDFRAGERTFQLLTQVAGRAGRGEMEGEVLVQTFTPFSPSIQFARHHDYEGFMEQEMDFRRQLAYPPYGRMVMITVRGIMRERAEFCAQTLARKLKGTGSGNVIVGEAVPAPLEKAKTFYRYQVSLRGSSSLSMSRLVRTVLDTLPMPEDVFVAVDVDPLHLL